MIGNDVIDLNLAREQHNWQRPRFLEKLFTEAEREFILDAFDPELIVWLLWSMKESAYKMVARMEEKRFYAPKQFECEVTLESSILPLCLCVSVFNSSFSSLRTPSPQANPLESYSMHTAF